MPLSYAHQRIIDPVDEPLEAQDVYLHARIPPTDTTQDVRIDGFIREAREKLEEDAQIAIMEQQWRYSLPKFYDLLQIPRPPLRTVDSVIYMDEDGVQQTVDPSVYTVHTDSFPGVLVLNPDQEWPTVQQGAYLPVWIEYTCGVERFLEVDNRVRQALLLLITHWYEHRGDTEPTSLMDIPHGYESLRRQLYAGLYTGSA